MGFSLLSYFYGYSKADINKLTLSQYYSDLRNIPEILKLLNGEQKPASNKDLIDMAKKYGLKPPKGY